MDTGTKPCDYDADCPSGQLCSAVTGMCVACSTCGTCPLGYRCDTSFDDDADIYVCEPCLPNCAGKECGTNGCNGQCGSCPVGWACVDKTDGKRVCEPPCDPVAFCGGRECGPNCEPTGCIDLPVGLCGVNGACSSGAVCDPGTNKCVTCTGSCGTCPGGFFCNSLYKCEEVVTPCTGKECGPDGQGGSCGECGEGTECNVDGHCVDIAPEVVEDISSPEPIEEIVEEPTTPEVVEDTTKAEDVQKPPVCQCDPGDKCFFGKCVKEPNANPEEDDDGGGGGCSAAGIDSRPNSLPVSALLALGLLLALISVRRRFMVR